MTAREIVEKALAGAKDAMVNMVSQETSEVDFESDRLKRAWSTQRTTIDLHVIAGGMVGVSTTTDAGDAEGLVRRALEAAAFGSEAHFAVPGPQALRDVRVFDPELLPLQKPEMIRTGRRMMDAIKSYNPEILAGAGVEKVIQRIEHANSRGAAYSEEHTDFRAGAGGQLIRGTDILFAGYGVGRKNRALDIDAISARAVGLFRMAERTAPVHSGVMPVIFMPEGLIVLLLSLALAIDGKNVLLGSSPLRGKLGEQIADPRLTVVDDPFVEFGPRTSSFDDEGTPRRVTPIVTEGVLASFVYDLDTAGRAGAVATGHGSGRALTNVVIDAGETPFAEMVRGTDRGLLVSGYLGLGQGNPMNGEFSVNVMLGYKIEHGEIVGRVKDVMLAGNAFSALKDITAISAEREWVGEGGAFSGQFPHVQVGALSVTAK